MNRADEVERAEFEKWAKGHPVFGQFKSPTPFDRDWSDSGEYRGPSIQLAWEVWQARASLPSPTGGGDDEKAGAVFPGLDALPPHDGMCNDGFPHRCGRCDNDVVAFAEVSRAAIYTRPEGHDAGGKATGEAKS